MQLPFLVQSVVAKRTVIRVFDGLPAGEGADSDVVLSDDLMRFFASEMRESVDRCDDPKKSDFSALLSDMFTTARMASVYSHRSLCTECPAFFDTPLFF